jgi:proton-coupled amino acid transporter
MDIESTPLIENSHHDLYSFESPTRGDGSERTKELPGKASRSETILVMVKMSIGTGVLGMPYAASKAGIMFHIIGLAFATLWNSYSVLRLAESRSYVEKNMKNVKQMGNVPQNTNTFGVMAWHAFGSVGLTFVDLVMIILMMGITIAYEDAILGFARDTELFTSGSEKVDALLMLIIMIPFLFLPNLDSLGKISALGTGLIFAVFIVFGGYGLHKNGLDGFYTLSSSDFWPRSFEAFSNWFGVVVFGFGIVPFTYSLQESMTERKDLMKATNASLVAVFIAYVIMGDIISIIFEQGINSDIISELPSSSTLPMVIRLLMIITILTSVPLIIIPLGELLHNRIVGSVKEASTENSVYMVRVFVAVFCAILSVEVPDFIHVISFLGCCCCALTSFTYPPLLHLRCIYRFCPLEERNAKIGMIVLDVILLICGGLLTVFTSILTFNKMLEQMMTNA